MGRSPELSSDIESDDREAVARCRAGALEAFAPLVQRHSPRIIRLCYHFLGDWEEARDLAQESFARAYHALGRYDPSLPFAGWITTIAARLATDRLRRRRLLRRKLSEWTPGQEPSSPASQELNLSLREALDHLTPRQRQSVVLCDLHGFTAGEAAAIINCSASTVRVLRFLARRRLRAELQASDGPLVLERGE